MPRYRRKPPEIEAWRFNAGESEPLPDWLKAAINAGRVWFQGGESPYYTVRTHEGTIRVNSGDYIALLEGGMLYAWYGSIFEANYERVP